MATIHREITVQARPETVESRRVAGSLKTYTLKQKGPVLVSGQAIGSAIAAGQACVIRSKRSASNPSFAGSLSGFNC